jgi:hypothetical protein|tara:strand:- start:147 stop:815 length:669 start_codon:yes stop_codon:yes gene_type:complete
MSVKIHGKEYRTVAERVNLFHEEHKDAVKSIKTKICFTEENKVVMKATVSVNDSIYTGHAEEVYDSSMINKTSALENCETSAIGRALASAGFGGTEFASADEVANAISQQNTKPSAPSSNGQAQSNEPYVHTDSARNSMITFGKHKGELWRDLPKDYVTWLANNSDNVKWQTMAVAEITARASENMDAKKKEDKHDEKEIQREMQLSSEPSLELGVDDDLPF